MTLPTTVFRPSNAPNELIAEGDDLAMQQQLATQAAGDTAAGQQCWLAAVADSSSDVATVITLSDLLEDRDPARALALDQELVFQGQVERKYRPGSCFFSGRGILWDVSAGFQLLF